MGQKWANTCYESCGAATEERSERIRDLEKSLQEQEIVKLDLHKKLKQEVALYKKHKHKPPDTEANRQKELLNREKKQVFRSLLNERKNALQLEDSIEECEKQLNGLESDVRKLQTKRMASENKARHAKFAQLEINLPLKPFKSKSFESSERSSDYYDDEETDEEEDEDIEHSIEQSTMILDDEYDAKTEAIQVYTWISNNKINFKQRESIRNLKQQLADLLTERSQHFRSQMVDAYYNLYGRNLYTDIEKVLVKGEALKTIRGLLLTAPQFDATLIQEHITSWDVVPVADIICCRTVEELEAISTAYKEKFKGNMKKLLQTLANKENKHTLVTVIGRILDHKRKEKEHIDVNLQQVNRDVKFVLGSRSFKKATKEKLILIFTLNSVQYIKVLNDQFKLKSKDSLEVFIDKHLGPKSTAGYFCKTRISYALRPSMHYADKIKDLGWGFKLDQTKISDILIQRMEVDLNEIEGAWKMKDLGDNRDLSAWIAWKTSDSMSGYFLRQMVKNCHRYTVFNKENIGGKRSKIEQMMMDH